MSTAGSLALETFEALHIEYEHAYGDNQFKVNAVKKAISLLPSTYTDSGRAARVLDVGCGTGVPTSQLLANAGLELTGIDIAPKMIAHAQARVKGTFIVTDMLTFTPTGSFAGVFFIFSHLHMHYADFHAALHKYAQTLEPNGLLVIGQMPAERYVPDDDSAWSKGRCYVDDYPAPFMGKPEPTLMMTASGQRRMLTSMGLEIVSETVDVFQPNNPKCEPEHQQYIVARRPGEGPVGVPQPLPREGPTH